VARLISGAPKAGVTHMKALFWIGMVVLILGIVSLVVPIRHGEQEGFRAGGFSVAVETRHAEKAPPLVSTAMILGGIGALVAGKMRSW